MAMARRFCDAMQPLGRTGLGGNEGRRSLRDCLAVDGRRVARLRAAAVHPLPQALALWRAVSAAVESLHHPAARLRAALDLADRTAVPAAVAGAVPARAALAALADRALGARRADGGEPAGDRVRPRAVPLPRPAARP